MASASIETASTQSHCPACDPLLASSVCPRFDFSHRLLSVGCRACALPIVEAAAIWAALVGGSATNGELSSWLLFVGDSDTRGIVFELLQLLVTGVHGVERAVDDTRSWLGFNVSDSSAGGRGDWLRRCVLDFVYDRHGTPVWHDSAHCTAQLGVGVGLPYIELGRDYNLSTLARMSRAVQSHARCSDPSAASAPCTPLRSLHRVC